MSDEYFQKIAELNTAEVPFAVATVIKTTGSVSAKHHINYSLGVNNLLNVNYIDHLSRLKTYDIPNPGRNIYVKLSLTI